MGFYNDVILPRLCDFAMRNKRLVPYRERVIGAAVALIDHVSSPCCVLAAIRKVDQRGPLYAKARKLRVEMANGAGAGVCTLSRLSLGVTARARGHELLAPTALRALGVNGRAAGLLHRRNSPSWPAWQDGNTDSSR